MPRGVYKRKKPITFSKEHRRRLSMALNGKKRSLLSDEQKKKLSIIMTGRVLSEKWKKKIGKSHLGKHPSPETLKKMSESRLGKPNLKNRKGNSITPLKNKIRYSLEYRKWRQAVLKIDNYTCQWCGRYGGALNADHIRSFSSILRKNGIKTLEQAIACRELWDVNNGRTLCRKCHEQTDSFKIEVIDPHVEVIGNGDIASVLTEGVVGGYKLFFASGVSNSKETRESEYRREIDLLLCQNRKKHIIYFSSFTAFYGKNRYSKHKRYMEALVKKNFPKYTIVRIGNITWGDNPNTLINDIRYKMENGIPVEIRDEYRYIVDMDEFLYWIKMIPEWSCEMNIPGKRMKVAEIVEKYVKPRL
jgi:hypothetical protein